TKYPNQQFTIDIKHIFNNESIIFNKSDKFDNQINGIVFNANKKKITVEDNKIYYRQYIISNNYILVANLKNIIIIYDRRKNKNNQVVSIDDFVSIDDLSPK